MSKLDDITQSLVSPKGISIPEANQQIKDLILQIYEDSAEISEEFKKQVAAL